MATKDITAAIERLEAFEERMGVRLEALSAFLEGGDEESFVMVHGELHPREGDQLADDVELIVAVYDSSGRIVGSTSYPYDAEEFFGFETFEQCVTSPVQDVARVRIYPKKST